MWLWTRRRACWIFVLLIVRCTPIHGNIDLDKIFFHIDIFHSVCTTRARSCTAAWRSWSLPWWWSGNETMCRTPPRPCTGVWRMSSGQKGVTWNQPGYDAFVRCTQLNQCHVRIGYNLLEGAVRWNQLNTQHNLWATLCKEEVIDKVGAELKHGEVISTPPPHSSHVNRVQTDSNLLVYRVTQHNFSAQMSELICCWGYFRLNGERRICSHPISVQKKSWPHNSSPLWK